MQKFFSNLALITLLILSPAFAGKVLAQNAPPPNAPVIELTTSTAGTSVQIKMRAAANDTDVWIETAPDTYTKTTVGIVETGFTNYTPTGTSLKIYGAITNFDCSGESNFNRNPVSAINASGNTGLKELYCSFNELTSLNVTGLTALEILNCRNNDLTSLNVTGLTALKELNCYNNALTSLNVTGLTALKELGCSFNALTSLNVTNLPALINLNCSFNALTNLNVSGLTAL